MGHMTLLYSLAELESERRLSGGRFLHFPPQQSAGASPASDYNHSRLGQAHHGLGQSSTAITVLTGSGAPLQENGFLMKFKGFISCKTKGLFHKQQRWPETDGRTDRQTLALGGQSFNLINIFQNNGR